MGEIGQGKAESILPFGLDANEIEAALAGKRDGRICMCGHPLTQHDEFSAGQNGCFPSRTICSCKTPFPVLDVSDKRFFQFSTTGWGERHAISVGLLALTKSGGTSRLLIESRCFNCTNESVKLIPTSLSSGNSILESTGEQNLLLCSSCWSEFPIRYSEGW